MKRVRLISWDVDDARKRALELEQAGVLVDASPFQPSGLVSQFRDVPAVCIDLDRLPSHGREIAVALRQTKATRYIPLIFAGGQRDKVLRIKKELPDAAFVEWPAAAGAIRKATRRAAASSPATTPEPVKPPSHMERYAGTPLSKKLGLVANMKVALMAAPDEFVEGLGDLPEGVTFAPKMNAETKLTLWWVRSRADLDRELEFVSTRLTRAAALWIVYPKKAGRHKSDLGQADVRAAALRNGLVDYKICSVDDDWSGLKFAHKK